MRRQQCLVVRPGRGADELAGVAGEQLGDRLSVLLVEGLPGDNHGASVHVLRAEACLVIALVKEGAQLLDALFEAFLRRRTAADWPRELSSMSACARPSHAGRAAQVVSA